VANTSSDLHSQSSGLLIQMLAGRWTLALLIQLADVGRRYQELHDALDGISYKVLTDTLRRTERDGLIMRHLDPDRIETATLYELTELGRSLDAPLTAHREWIEANWSAVDSARQHWDRLCRARA
jgi:DNA-binding HxlR family transcriptional regulator